MQLVSYALPRFRLCTGTCTGTFGVPILFSSNEVMLLALTPVPVLQQKASVSVQVSVPYGVAMLLTRPRSSRESSVERLVRSCAVCPLPGTQGPVVAFLCRKQFCRYDYGAPAHTL